MKSMSICVEALNSRATVDEREAGFSSWVGENQHRVFQIAYSVLGNASDAEEIAQEVFLQAYQRLTALREPEKFSAWVGRIAFRLALNRQRDRRRQLARDTAWRAAHLGPMADGASSADNRIFLDRLRGEIEALPERLRAVLLLCAVEGMEASEVAAVLQIPAGTVRSRLHLARKRLLGALSL